MLTQLPLFPLGTVMFPGLVMPLHIFERRYRVLVQALTQLPESAPRQFGVIAIRTGREVGEDGLRALYPVGCTAALREVTPYEDGRFDIVVVGETRFRLDSLDEDAGTPYHTGTVELLEEPDGADDIEPLARTVGLRFAAYRERLGMDQPPVPGRAHVLSYLVAAAAVLDLADRQRLLEEPTTAARLEAEHVLLRRETALIEAFGALPAVDLTRVAVNPN